MTGRNSKPDNTGPASQPSRLDQFGDKIAEDTVPKDGTHNPPRK
ncbi:hypothetical protein [Paenibacillus hamazuiensis]|nr:hypothetical protein [Paenibacillus hamazuiensis]